MPGENSERFSWYIEGRSKLKISNPYSLAGDYHLIFSPKISSGLKLNLQNVFNVEQTYIDEEIRLSIAELDTYILGCAYLPPQGEGSEPQIILIPPADIKKTEDSIRLLKILTDYCKAIQDEELRRKFQRFSTMNLEYFKQWMQIIQTSTKLQFITQSIIQRTQKQEFEDLLVGFKLGKSENLPLLKNILQATEDQLKEDYENLMKSKADHEASTVGQPKHMIELIRGIRGPLLLDLMIPSTGSTKAPLISSRHEAPESITMALGPEEVEALEDAAERTSRLRNMQDSAAEAMQKIKKCTEDLQTLRQAIQPNSLPHTPQRVSSFPSQGEDEETHGAMTSDNPTTNDADSSSCVSSSIYQGRDQHVTVQRGTKFTASESIPNQLDMQQFSWAEEIKNLEYTCDLIKNASSNFFQKNMISELMATFNKKMLEGRTPVTEFLGDFLSKFEPINSQEKRSIVPTLKLSHVTLPNFSGQESEYFEWKLSTKEILKSTGTPDEANLVAIKAACFKDANLAVINAVKSCSTLQELFDVLDNKFGNKMSHSSRISKEIASLKPMEDGNYPSIISFVEEFDNLTRQATKSGAPECIINDHTYVLISNKMSALQINEFLKDFPNQATDIIETKMDDMKKFLHMQRARAQLAKCMRGSEYKGKTSIHSTNLSSLEKHDTNQGSKAGGQETNNGQQNSHGTATKKDGQMDGNSGSQPRSNKRFYCLLCNVVGHSSFMERCPITSGKIMSKHIAQLKQKNFCMICTNPHCREQSYCQGYSNFLCLDGCNENIRVCKHTLKTNEKAIAGVKVNSLTTQGSYPDHRFDKNSLGKTLMLTENILIKHPRSGNSTTATVYYDLGCTDTIVTGLENYVEKTGQIENFSISGFTENFETAVSTAPIVNFKINTIRGALPINAIQVPEISNLAHAEIKVPPVWKDKFSNNVFSRNEKVDLLMGGNHCFLFPVEVDRYVEDGQCLILYRSMITNDFLLYGRNKECITMGKLPTSINRLELHTNECKFVDLDDINALNFREPERNNVISHDENVSRKDLQTVVQNVLDKVPREISRNVSREISKNVEKQDFEKNAKIFSKIPQNISAKISQNISDVTESPQNPGKKSLSDVGSDNPLYPGKKSVLNFEEENCLYTGKKLDTDFAEQSITGNKMQNMIKVDRMCAEDKMEKLFNQQLTAEQFPTVDMKSHEQEKKKLEEEEMARHMTYCNETKTWKVQYIYNNKLQLLEDGYATTYKRMLALDKKLRKNPEICKTVNEEIRKNIENGHWKETDKLNLDPTLKQHFIPINFVAQPSSKTTPVRIILDPSAKGKNNLSLNDCQAYGLSQIGDLRGCLLRWRTAQKVALGDISKFFNSFVLNPEDQSLRRLLLPEKGFGNHEDGKLKLVQYCMVNMGFGDRASPILAGIGKIRNLDTFINETKVNLKEKVTKTLTTNSYVDDCFASCAYDEDIGEITKEVDELLEKGNMRMKKWIYMDEEEPQKYLGYNWTPKEDKMSLKNWFNIAKKKRGINENPDLNLDNIQELSKSFTRRSVLRIQGQFYDPLLILSPVVVKIRLLFAKVCMEQKTPIDWDKKLSPDLQEALVSLYGELSQYKDFSFRRSIIPKELSGTRPECSLITFTDGSLSAYAACSYIRFTHGGKIYSNLLASTVKIAGSRKLTPPQSEILGAQAGVQLALQIQEEVADNLDIKNVVYITDSRIIISQLRLKSASFDVFTGQRVAFIQDNTANAKWLWCPGKENPADLPTRNLTTYEEVTSPKWLNGGFLLQEEDEWPTKSLTTEDIKDLPPASETLFTAKMFLNTMKVRGKDDIEISKLSATLERHRSLQTVMNILSWILKWKYKDETSSELNKRAKNILIRDSAPVTERLLKKTKLWQGEKLVRDGIMYLKMRNFEGMQETELLVMSGYSPLGALLIKSGHDDHHLKSNRAIQAKIQSKGFYIPRLAPFLSAEKKHCMTCRKILHSPSLQRMGDVKKQRFMQSKPFVEIYLDLAGPFRSFDSIKKRTTGKVWALVVSCCYTRAIFTYCLTDYTADSVVNALYRHKARFGSFRAVFSDLGTNLVAAAQTNTQDTLPEVGKLQKLFRLVKWNFGVPKAPWMVGGAEASVKLMKQQMKILKIKEGEKKLSAIEYETLFARISSIVNERPLVIGGEPGMVLTPNDLLYGHNNTMLDHESPQETVLTKRTSAIQESLNSWWKIYRDSYMLSAAKLEKWKTVEENLEVGDICLMLDSPNKVGSFQIAKVTEVHPDERGLVRKVTVKHTTPSGLQSEVKRPSHKLSKLTTQIMLTNDVVDDDDDVVVDDDVIDDDDFLDDDIVVDDNIVQGDDKDQTKQANSQDNDMDNNNDDNLDPSLKIQAEQRAPKLKVQFPTDFEMITDIAGTSKRLQVKSKRKN